MSKPSNPPRPSGAAFEREEAPELQFLRRMAMGADGLLWVLDSSHLKTVSAIGEVSTRIDPAGFEDAGLRPIDLAVGSDGRVFLLGFDGSNLTVVLRQHSGALVRLAQFPHAWGPNAVTPALAVAAGELRIVTNFPGSLTTVSLDGGGVSTRPLPDGNGALAVDAQGRTVFANGWESCHVWRDEGDGGTSWLAGPVPSRQVLVDGPVAFATFRMADNYSRASVALSPEGGIDVSDDGAIRHIFGGAVTTVGTLGWSGWNNAPDVIQDLSSAGGEEWGVTSTFLWKRRPGQAPVQVSALPPANVSRLAADPRGGWFVARDGEVMTWRDDAGLAPFASTASVLGIVADGDGGVLVTNSSTIRRVDSAGLVTEFARLGFFANLDGIARDQRGFVYVADRGTSSSIFRFDPDGTGLTTIVRLADAPSSLVVEDGGSLLVTVPRAVLRVRP